MMMRLRKPLNPKPPIAHSQQASEKGVTCAFLKSLALAACVTCLLFGNTSNAAESETEKTIDTPASEKHKPQSDKNNATENTPPTQRFALRKTTFLGVATSPAPASLIKQLNLPEGFGLVVEHVAPNSPAGAAGIKRNDVIHRLDNQKIINNAQLSILVRSHKAGDQIKLVVYRPAAEPDKEKASVLHLQAKLIAKAIPFVTGAPNNGANASDATGQQPVNRVGDPLRFIQLPNGQQVQGVDGVPLFVGQSHSVLRYADLNHELTLRENNEGKKLTAKIRPTGETLFEGPVDSETQRKLIPEDILKKLIKLEKVAHAKVTVRRIMPTHLQPNDNTLIEFNPKKLNAIMEQHLKDFDPKGLSKKQIQDKVDAIRKQVQDLIQSQLLEQQKKRAAAKQNAGINSNSPQFLTKATAIYADGSHRLELSFDSKSRHLKVTDLSARGNAGNPGNVIFDGPIDTQAQRNAVPKVVQQKLETLEKSTRLEIIRIKPAQK
jgi:hypothetical protein